MVARLLLAALCLAAGFGFGVLISDDSREVKLGYTPDIPAKPEASFTWGLSGEIPASFSDPRFRALGVKAARVQVSWDLFSNPEAASMPGLLDERRRLKAWFSEAQKAGVQKTMVSFKASRDTPDYLPDLKEYRQGTTKVLKVIERWGYKVSQLSPWNEPDLTLPLNPRRAGEFYRRVARLCESEGCEPVAGDFTDTHLTRAYFESYLKTSGPAKLWALHAYGAGRERSLKKLRQIISWLPQGSKVELTEQGGVVSRPGGRPQSEREAAEDLRFLLNKAARLPEVQSFYVYQWQGEAAPRWDSGLISPEGATREGYCVFAEALGSKACA